MCLKQMPELCKALQGIMRGNAPEMFTEISFGRFHIAVLQCIFRQNITYFIELAGGVVSLVQNEVVDPFGYIQKQRVVTGIKTI